MNERIQPYFDYPKCRIIFDGRPLGSYSQITGSDSAMPIAADLFGECVNHHEEFYCLFLNHAHHLIGVMQLSKGGCNATTADIRILMQGAILANADALMLMHNHPSGDPKPGQTDINLTNEIRKAAELFGITLLDHIVVADGIYYTFAEDEKRPFPMPKPAAVSECFWGYGREAQQELF